MGVSPLAVARVQQGQSGPLSLLQGQRAQLSGSGRSLPLLVGRFGGLCWLPTQQGGQGTWPPLPVVSGFPAGGQAAFSGWKP